MNGSPRDVTNLVKRIAELPASFHQAGVMTQSVLMAIARLTSEMTIQHSAETGSGKSTLLFSHLSPHHTVFAKDQFGDFDVHSMAAVREAELFNAPTTQFIEGATQQTLPVYSFQHPLDLVLIDGPHGYPFPDLEYFYFYPHLRPGALLIVDDIHIPNIGRMFEFLAADAMFELVEVVGYTGFLRRTDAPCFDPFGDGWWLQNFNQQRQAHMCRDAEQMAERLMTKRDIGLPGTTQHPIYRLLAGIGAERFARRLRYAYQAFRDTPDGHE